MKRREGVEVSIYELGVGGQKNVLRVEEHAARWRETFVNYFDIAYSGLQKSNYSYVHIFGIFGENGFQNYSYWGKGVPSYEF